MSDKKIAHQQHLAADGDWLNVGSVAASLKRTLQDRVTEHLALDALDAHDDLVTVLRESESYRFVLLAAVRRLHDAQREIGRLREQNHALREEIRRYTAKQTIGHAA